MSEKVRLSEKFAQFAEHWTPKIAGELNDSYILLTKLHGEFVWHAHAGEDEFFLVITYHSRNPRNLCGIIRQRGVDVGCQVQ